MDEQGPQEDLEEKLKEYVDGLTDKRYPALPASSPPGSLTPAQPLPGMTKGGLPT